MEQELAHASLKMSWAEQQAWELQEAQQQIEEQKRAQEAMVQEVARNREAVERSEEEAVAMQEVARKVSGCWVEYTRSILLRLPSISYCS